KTIISSPTEHDCVLRTLERLKSEESVNVIFVDVDHNAEIESATIASLILENKIHGKVLVSLMHGNNEVGTLLDIDKIAAICRENGAYFHSDMVQTIGKMEIDVQKTPLSFISGSGHKFHGPKGVGFFYMNAENIIQPLILGGAQERNMRAGTENSVGIAGLAEALQLYAIHRSENVAKVSLLRDNFENQLLEKIPTAKINASGARSRLPHISSVSFDAGEKGDLLIFNLDIHGISASSGSACSSGIEHDSHVLIAIGHPSQRKTVRFSFSHFNTLQEVDQVVEALLKMQ
ncbi:MAG TPA: aminotransferase class V-fold PLP-dependent enzyme, partial [Saprospiraceae bacterium]|nr:aminotransferase class V-fold PLP-dependent enzyme [Saprospiraceae bacterium]